ncbi:hypothetical protein WMY93_026271 [Mugilogobius chulae]|uniref:Ig-like domain-containing protein n=1 Tax=Mugilogobius chulae TaxID=88201 RepID=A0AAW0N1A0_9GOBI
MVFLLVIGFLLSMLRGSAPHSSDVVMFATLGDSVTLPCHVSHGSRCSSISWISTDPFFGIVKNGQVKAPNMTFLTDCSLHINYMDSKKATIYTCYNDETNASADLQFLNITENTKTEDKTELQCYLNNFKGLSRSCNKTGLQVRWLAEDNTLLKGERFKIENISNCFSKLHIQTKKTDHLRQWKCEASLNGTGNVTASYQTTVTDGIEEVFAAVSQSVSLTCSNASSLALTEVGQKSTSFSDTGSNTIIRNVLASNSGEYQCIDKGNPKTIWLHTVDIISEMDSREIMSH